MLTRTTIQLAALMLLMTVAAQPSAGQGVQQPAASGQPVQQTPGQAAPAKPDQTPPADTYTYRAEGRRDPFLSLLFRGVEARPAGQPAEGLANLTVGEIVLKGILRSRGAYLAMVQGPNQKTYIVRPKERLVDGVIKEITADSIVIVQDVNDPLSVTKQKEVRKTLREL